MPFSRAQPAVVSDSAALATLHHAAFMAAPYTAYVNLWRECAEEELWRLHAEIFEEIIADAGVGADAGGKWSGKGRARVLVLREAGNGDVDGEIVGFAWWNAPLRMGGGEGGNMGVEGREKGENDMVEMKGREGAERKYVKKDEPPSFPEGYNASLMNRKNEETERRKQALPESADHMWHLSWLATKPGHQGRGVATTLVGWGFDRADEEGRMCYVSTDLDSQAYKLYEKMGFKAMGPLTELDLADYGGKGRLRYVTMVREPWIKQA